MEDNKTADAAKSGTTKPDVNVVQAIHGLLVKSKSPLAEKFLDLKHVKRADGQPCEVQRHLVNYQLRLLLSTDPKNTELARAALDDHCPWPDYLSAFKQHALPALV